MNQELAILSPSPKKFWPSVLNYFAIKEKTPNKMDFSSIEIQELINMRSNSQNPHEKDEIFKCQSQESLGEEIIDSEWEKFEEEICDCHKYDERE